MLGRGDLARPLPDESFACRGRETNARGTVAGQATRGQVDDRSAFRCTSPTWVQIKCFAVGSGFTRGGGTAPAQVIWVAARQWGSGGERKLNRENFRPAPFRSSPYAGH